MQPIQTNKDPTCYKNSYNLSCIDLLLTIFEKSFKKRKALACTIDIGLSDLKKNKKKERNKETSWNILLKICNERASQPIMLRKKLRNQFLNAFIKE